MKTFHGHTQYRMIKSVNKIITHFPIFLTVSHLKFTLTYFEIQYW